jgi:hypothetical protein
VRHFNSQATSIFLASLCREKYNKVQGLKNAKEIWDVLKTAHEGDEVTKITKRGIIEGELGRFVLNKGEEPWYKQMSPEEVIGKFVSFELMVKDSKHIINFEHSATSTPEVQPVTFKATEEKKEDPTPTNRLLIDASKLDNKQMTLIIKSLRQILKQRKGKEYKPRSKRVCYRCGKSSHYIAKCPYENDSDKDDDKEGKKKMEKKKYYNKKKGGEAHMGREWDSDESSTDSSSDKDAANIDINKGLLFPQRRPQVPHGQGGQKEEGIL